jgi:hypothetical protein
VADRTDLVYACVLWRAGLAAPGKPCGSKTETGERKTTPYAGFPRFFTARNRGGKD